MPREGDVTVDCAKVRNLLLDCKLTPAAAEKKLYRHISHSVWHRMLGGSENKPLARVNVRKASAEAFVELARETLKRTPDQLPLEAIRAQPDEVPLKTPTSLEEIYVRQHGHPLLDPKQLPLPGDAARIRPTELLQAKFQSIDYWDVTGTKADLLGWCADDRRLVAGRLIHGAGGLGKTRLLIQTTAELRGLGWRAGFLNGPENMNETISRQHWQALEQLIAHGDDSGLLVVIDYAEGHQEEVRRLATALSVKTESAASHGRLMRLVLLARSAGGWWQALINERPEVQRLFHREAGATDVIAMPAIETSAQRLAFFELCLDGFAETLRGRGYQPRQTEPPPHRRQYIVDGEGHMRPLAIQMEALLHLTSAAPDLPGIDKQIENVLGLERAHWGKILRVLGREAKRDMDRGIAQVTAANGAPNRPAAERLLLADAFYKRASRAEVEPVYQNLAMVYGGADGALLHLEPDLIGEHQVASIGDTELIDGCLRWMEGEPKAEWERRRNTLLRVLQRASLPDHGEQVSAQSSALLRHLVRTRLTTLATAMVAAILTEPGGTLRNILVEQLRELDKEPLTALADALPVFSVTLMEFSLAVWTRCVEQARELLAVAAPSEESKHPIRLASLGDLATGLGRCSVCLFQLGQQEKALAADEEALNIHRQLAGTQPDAFLPSLAESLSRHGAHLVRPCQQHEALAASQEAVDIRRRLAKTRPDTFLPLLAASLINLSKALRAFGRREEALAASSEARDIHRRLTEPHSDELVLGRARNLENHSFHLSELGRQKEALAASQEALDDYRRLAETRPDAFLPDLAVGLSSHSVHLSGLGRLREALAARQEAVYIRRRLAKIRPDTFLPLLAESLRILGLALAKVERVGEALAAFEEGMRTIAPLVERHPYLGDLARQLEHECRRVSE